MPAKKKAGAKKRPAKRKSLVKNTVNMSFSGEDISKGIEQGAKKSCCCTGDMHKHVTGGCAYFLGFIGAVVYYISTATGFWNGVWGVIKALLWPAFLVHGLMGFIGL